jgi:hypothetical protein
MFGPPNDEAFNGHPLARTAGETSHVIKYAPLGVNERHRLVTSVICAGCQSSLIIGAMSAIVELQGTVKAKYARLCGTVLRGVVLIVALCAYVAVTKSLLYRGNWEVPVVVFATASWAL